MLLPDSGLVNICQDLHGFIFFNVRISLCSPGCTGTHSRDQASLELIGLCLPLPPECWLGLKVVTPPPSGHLSVSLSINPQRITRHLFSLVLNYILYNSFRKTVIVTFSHHSNFVPLKDSILQFSIPVAV